MLNSRLSIVLIVLAAMVASCSKPRNNSSYTGNDAIAIVVTDTGYVAPDTIPAGVVHLSFENQGEEIHELMFIRLPDGMSADDYAAAVAAGQDFPEGAVDCSGVGLTAPGEREGAWLPLDPGNYILVCWFRDHAERRPGTIVVSGAPSRPAPAPDGNATIRLIDFRFEIIGDIHRGDNVLRVETVGPSMHEMDIFRLDEGKTIDDLRDWQKNHKQGPAPARAMGGVLDSHDLSRVVHLERFFEPGNYVLWCSMPMIQNATGGDPHVSHADAGMFKEFTVQP